MDYIRKLRREMKRLIKPPKQKAASGGKVPSGKPAGADAEDPPPETPDPAKRKEAGGAAVRWPGSLRGFGPVTMKTEWE